MEMPSPRPSAHKPRPDYPPKTPPPPKKPPSPPPPETLTGPDAMTRTSVGRGRRVMANRQGAAWILDVQPWAKAKGAHHVAEQLLRWGCHRPEGLDDLVRFLMATVMNDGGRRVSLHLAEESQRALVLALSHQPRPPAMDATVLPRLQVLGALSCGTEATVEGRQVWAVVDLARGVRTDLR
ncbi:hypothetical protein [Streptomyces sp. NPDC020965]|uniref:hypothetical protein n=1 Tax=Streptomyces sp. NPDC020965 TaxID=3365105 RepID=UPI003798CEA1